MMAGQKENLSIKFFGIKDTVDSRLEELVANYDDPETTKIIQNYFDRFAQFHRYSFRNMILIDSQAKDRNTHVSYIRSFDDWGKIANENGEYVRINKGEEGYIVTIPNVTKVWQVNKNGEPLIDENGNRMPALNDKGQQTTITRFSLGRVFDISQTNALEIGAIKKLPFRENSQDITEEFLQEMVQKISNTYNIKIKFKHLTNEQHGGLYATTDETITINSNPRRSASEKLSTLFHELGHSRMHNKFALAQYKKNTGQELSRGQIEAQTKAFDYVITKEFGINSKSELYLKAWKDDFNVVDLNELFINVKRAINDVCTKLNISSYNIVHEDLPEVKLESYNHRKIRVKMHKNNDDIKHKQDIERKGELTPEEIKTRNAAKDKLKANGNVILFVKFQDRDEARMLGAKFDKEAKVFYVTKNTDMNKLRKFIPKSPQTNKKHTTTRNYKLFKM
ncbi:MAG: DUF5710 domain-containing protein [Campylobacteraceae bacterium]|jgi:Zn-dependent peptidase ImmA (M78 family)|nr:DUF5710 domain-containing protein [Campylobacteraceae bacterium]